MIASILINGAGLLLAAFVIGWFWLSGPSQPESHDHHHHH